MRTFTITDHKLDRFPFQPSPNRGGKLVNGKPTHLVMHYTAGRNFQADLASMLAPASKAAAHVLIGRGGQVTQLIEFDTVAWHAGASYFDGLRAWNQFSIGVELSNPGLLKRQGNGWVTWYQTPVPPDQAIAARHWKDNVEYGWVPYTDEQLESAAAVGRALRNTYRILGVVGHEDINKEKYDPGPLFPMERFRRWVMNMNLLAEDAVWRPRA